MFHFLSRMRIISPSTITTTLKNQPCVFLKFISTSSDSKAHSFTVSYLINTCAFSPQRAASLSNQMSFETREKPDSVIRFFTNLGFSQTQMFNVIRSVPCFLIYDPHKTFNPKIEFFKSKGFSNSDILSIISGCPEILRRSLEKQIIPCFDLFDSMFRSKDKFMKAIIRHSGILFDFDQYSAPNMKLLRLKGVPKSQIIKFVEYFPRTLKEPPKRFKDMAEEVKELGFNPVRLNFVKAIHVKICLSRSTWERKEGIYERWGWTDNDVRAAFKSYPFCMAISENKIEAIMDFVVNKLGYASSDIVRCPVLLAMSVEKRIIPRVSVILVLLTKGLVKKLSLRAIFVCSEKVFLDKFIHCHENEADELLKLYQAKLALAQ